MDDMALHPGQLPATDPDPASIPLNPEMRARMLLYRLVPLWVFLLTLGITFIWDFGVRGTEATPARLQAVVLLALLVTLLIGAPIGIRWFNPLPIKK